MKIFISWSGSKSKRLASLFAELLPSILQSAQPFFSPDDIGKGARWNTEIAKALEESYIGILILTVEILISPWILFEAGALSRVIEHSRICPVLFDVEPNELPAPLLQFQVTLFNEGDFRRLFNTINSAQEYPLGPRTINIVFDHYWPDFYEIFKKMPAEPDDN
jgi:hypothetical protein